MPGSSFHNPTWPTRCYRPNPTHSVYQSYFCGNFMATDKANRQYGKLHCIISTGSYIPSIKEGSKNRYMYVKFSQVTVDLLGKNHTHRLTVTVQSLMRSFFSKEKRTQPSQTHGLTEPTTTPRIDRPRTRAISTVDNLLSRENSRRRVVRSLDCMR